MKVLSGDAIDKLLKEEKNKLFDSIRSGQHKQFELKDGVVKCKCGYQAIWWNTDYICGTITAYPCKYC